MEEENESEKQVVSDTVMEKDVSGAVADETPVETEKSKRVGPLHLRLKSLQRKAAGHKAGFSFLNKYCRKRFTIAAVPVTPSSKKAQSIPENSVEVAITAQEPAVGNEIQIVSIDQESDPKQTGSKAPPPKPGIAVGPKPTAGPKLNLLAPKPKPPSLPRPGAAPKAAAAAQETSSSNASSVSDSVFAEHSQVPVLNMSRRVDNTGFRSNWPSGLLYPPVRQFAQPSFNNTQYNVTPVPQTGLLPLLANVQPPNSYYQYNPQGANQPYQYNPSPSHPQHTPNSGFDNAASYASPAGRYFPPSPQVAPPGIAPSFGPIVPGVPPPVTWNTHLSSERNGAPISVLSTTSHRSQKQGSVSSAKGSVISTKRKRSSRNSDDSTSSSSDRSSNRTKVDRDRNDRDRRRARRHSPITNRLRARRSRSGDKLKKNRHHERRSRSSTPESHIRERKREPLPFPHTDWFHKSDWHRSSHCSRSRSPKKRRMSSRSRSKSPARQSSKEFSGKDAKRISSKLESRRVSAEKQSTMKVASLHLALPSTKKALEISSEFYKSRSPFKRFMCLLCKKSASDMQLYLRHANSDPHRGDEKAFRDHPFSCILCVIKFDDLQAYSKHIKSKEHRYREENKDQKHFRCVLCKQGTYDETIYRRHLESDVHLNKLKLHKVEVVSLIEFTSGVCKMSRADAETYRYKANFKTAHKNVAEKRKEPARDAKKKVEEVKKKLVEVKKKTEEVNKKTKEIKKRAEEVKKKKEAPKIEVKEQKEEDKNRYLCFVCKEATCDLEIFLRHLKSDAHLDKEKEKKRYICYVCEKEFKNDEYHLRHLKSEVHLQKELVKKPFICTVCKESFKSQELFIIHVESEVHLNKVKSEKQQIKVKLEEQQIKVKLEVQQDKARSEGRQKKEEKERNAFCKVCRIDCKSRSAYLEHLKSDAHIEMDKPYACRVCKARYRNTWHLFNHLNEKGHIQKIKDESKYSKGESNFACVTCNASFRSLQSKNDHLNSTAHLHKVQEKDRDGRKRPSKEKEHPIKRKKPLNEELDRHSEERKHADEEMTSPNNGKRQRIAEKEKLAEKETDNYLKCLSCVIALKSKEELIDHLKSDYHLNYHYLCKECNKKFRTKKAYECHLDWKNYLKNVGKMEEQFPCHLCETNCDNQKILDFHLKSAAHLIRLLPFACPACRKRFSNKEDCTLHVEAEDHKSCAAFACNDCKYSCKTEADYNDHLSSDRHLYNEDEDGICIGCGNCKMSYLNKERHAQHLVSLRHIRIQESADNLKNFICDICQKIFTTNEDHVRHMEWEAYLKDTDQTKNQFACHMCEKSFTTEENYTQHLQSEDHLKPFVCCVCKNRFENKETYAHHLNKEGHLIKEVEVGENLLFYCHPCKLILDSNESYNTHLASASHLYNGKKDVTHFACHECKMSFKTKEDFAHHLRTLGHKKRDAMLKIRLTCGMCSNVMKNSEHFIRHLEWEASLNLKTEQHSCHLCEESFAIQETYNSHLVSEGHLIEEKLSANPFACALCENRYSTRKHYVSHLKSHDHSNVKAKTSKTKGLFACDECQKCFKTKTSLIQHMTAGSHLKSVEEEEAKNDEKASLYEPKAAALQKNEVPNEQVVCLKPVPKIPLYCDVCNILFNVAKNYLRHLKSYAHLDEVENRLSRSDQNEEEDDDDAEALISRDPSFTTRSVDRSRRCTKKARDDSKPDAGAVYISDFVTVDAIGIYEGNDSAAEDDARDQIAVKDPAYLSACDGDFQDVSASEVDDVYDANAVSNKPSSNFNEEKNESASDNKENGAQDKAATAISADHSAHDDDFDGVSTSDMDNANKVNVAGNNKLSENTSVSDGSDVIDEKRETDVENDHGSATTLAFADAALDNTDAILVEDATSSENIPETTPPECSTSVRASSISFEKEVPGDVDSTTEIAKPDRSASPAAQSEATPPGELDCETNSGNVKSDLPLETGIPFVEINSAKLAPTVDRLCGVVALAAVIGEASSVEELAIKSGCQIALPSGSVSSGRCEVSDLDFAATTIFETDSFKTGQVKSTTEVKGAFLEKLSSDADPIAAALEPLASVASEASTTRKPVAVASEPVIDVPESVTPPLKPATVEGEQVTSPQEPVISSQEPVIITVEPVSPPQEPVTVAVELATSPQDPVTITVEPDTSPQEPVTVTVEPDTSPQEPVTSPQEPVTSPQEPVTSPQEPVTSPQEPVTSPQEPVTSPQEHVTSPQEPVTSPQEPVTSPQEPVTSPQEPVTTPQKPVTVTVKPVTSPLEPVTSPLEPVTSPLEPVTSPLEPVTSPLEPVTSPLEPVTSPLEPVTSPLEPVTSPLEPVTSPLEPVTSPLEPVTSPLEPVTSPLEPVTSPLEPVTSPQEPVILTVKPVTSPQEPVTITVGPGNITVKPVTTTEEPVAFSQGPVTFPLEPVTFPPDLVVATPESVTVSFETGSATTESEIHVTQRNTIEPLQTTTVNDSLMKTTDDEVLDDSVHDPTTPAAAEENAANVNEAVDVGLSKVPSVRGRRGTKRRMTSNEAESPSPRRSRRFQPS